MDQQTRMFKILAALAISMIGGALMLSGSAASRSHSSAQPALLLHAGAPPQSVASDSSARAFQELVVIANPATERNMLKRKGLGDAPQAHVIIGPRGLIQVQPAWHRGERFEHSGAALVVRIDCPASASELSPTQSDALASLLDHLRSLPDLISLPVRHESHHPAIHSLSDHLRAHVGDNQEFSFAG
jgi:hypothetical protein